MTKENKIYFIEVYENEFGNSDNEAELIGQEEYPSLLAAYDAAKDIPEMYSGFNFDHLEIVDSEDLNRVYYTFSTFNGGKIHEWELHELINNRNNAAEIEEIDASEYAVSVEAQEVAINAEIEKAAAEAEIANTQTAVRKEISKDDYKFFIGRVEKISNGQVGFIADTQKKAVELLGEKIPQNVIGTANNYKAFNIWLGSEINPIIVGDGGYKEEIHIFGDGYDFFEVKTEKVAEVEEISPSIEKIFAAVTTEIKPHIRGKYFVQINDNWREQEIREKFSTLEDAVRVAWIMYSELCKVSRHIYATVEARTVDINKLWDRADDWTTFYEINSDGEKINRRETIEVISKIDNRTVEEVRNDIGRCGDNYGFYKNSAPVEEANAEIIACIDDYIVNVDAAAEVEERNAIESYFIKSEQWTEESNAILEKTVFAALKDGRSIKLFQQGKTNFEDCIELIDCYTLSEKDVMDGTFCSDIYEEGGEITFTPVSLKGVSYSLADYKTKEQFHAVAVKLAEAIQRGDEQFVFPTIEELESAVTEISTIKPSEDTIKVEINDYNDDYGEKKLNSILVKVNGLDVIYYGYGFGPDFHEYDEKLLHINVDRDKHSLTDSKYDEFKTYKSKKKMNTALARYGLNFEQVEQFFANEQSKMDCENEKIHAFIADALNMGDAERGKKIKLIPQKDLGKSYVMLTARDVASRDFDYRKMCDGEYHIRTCRKWSFTLSSVAVYETEQQAHEVVKMLGVAIQRGEEYFTFPEVEEVTTPAEEKNRSRRKFWRRNLRQKTPIKNARIFSKICISKCAVIIIPRQVLCNM